jgi:hypothetical protein
MEYVEMPDLVLTGRQARRLWNLDGAFLRGRQMSSP